MARAAGRPERPRSPTPTTAAWGFPIALIGALWLTLAAPPALSAPSPATTASAPPLVIPPGREPVVTAIAGDLWGAPGPGLRLVGARVEGHRVHFTLAVDGATRAALVLDHPDTPAAATPPDATPLAAGAWLACAPPPCADAAVDAWRPHLAAAIARRDARAPELWVGRAAAVRDVRLDGYIYLAALLLAFALALRELARLGRRERLAALALFAAALALRAALSPAEPLGVHTWQRTLPTLEWLVLRPGAPLAPLVPVGADYFDVAFAFHAASNAILLPCVLAHARFALRSVGRGDDARLALVATAAFAFQLIPVLFAHSDVTFASSLLLSTATFVLLYAAALAHHRVLALLPAAAAVALFHLTLTLRPLNFLFGLVALLALLAPPAIRRATTRQPAAWLALAAIAALTARAIAATAADPMLASHTAHGASLFATLVTDNPWLRPDLVPLPLIAAFFVGAAWLTRRHLGVALLLGGWFFMFLVAHGVVPPQNDLVRMRYAMHTALPFAFVAAAGAVVLWDRLAPRLPGAPVRAALAAALAALWLPTFAPLWAPPDDRREELTFLRDLETRGLLPTDGLVVEPGRPRLPRLFARWDGAALTPTGPAWSPTLPPPAAREAGPLYLYLGLGCHEPDDRSGRPDPRCADVLAAGPWSPVATHLITGPRHDAGAPFGPEGAPITLYRWRPAPPTP